MPLLLTDPVTKIPLVGPHYASGLKRLSINTVEDLLYHFPTRYENFGEVKLIKDLVAGEQTTIKAHVDSISNIYTKYGKRLTKATVSDSTGKIDLWWFNQHYLIKNIKPGHIFYFSGKMGIFSNKPALSSPEYEKVEENGGQDSRLHTGQLVPVYPETGGISSKWLRSRIKHVLRLVTIEDFLPVSITDNEKIVKLSTALHSIHLPQNEKDYAAAEERLAFDELLVNILKGLYKRRIWHKKASAPRLIAPKKKIDKFLTSLSFKLTTDQEKSIKEILNDLKAETAMNRLLQGDVGCGKTVVAATAGLNCCLCGYNTVYMAPTQILAMQQKETLVKMLAPFGIEVTLVKGGSKKEPLSEICDKYRITGKGGVLVGTHALLYKKELRNTGLIVIDEQHRFGVKQRAKLGVGDNFTPHTLTMTATPIPRSLALTIYGDLDISAIETMPPGRIPTTTWLVPNNKRKNAYQWLEQEVVKTKGQIFWVCPFIESSTNETLQNVRAAEIEFNLLKKEFRKLSVDILHGRMKPQEKETILNKFRQGKTQILVTTPVVEVGVDVPNANFIVVEGAERFGFASLHQLRGRVGRGGEKSYCLLFTSSEEFERSSRLKALERIRNGVQLAKLDLKIRGAGELYGVAQHGRFSFKLASFSDTKLLTRAKKQAQAVTKQLEKYPLLLEKVKQVEKIALN